MKHIQLFETWQWHENTYKRLQNRDYTTTVKKLLDWAVGEEWEDSPEEVAEVIMIDGEWQTEGEFIHQHQVLKYKSPTPIEVESQELDTGEILTSFVLNGTEFSLVSFDWPFEDEDSEGMTQAESEVFLKLNRSLSNQLSKLEADPVHIIDYIKSEVQKGVKLGDLNEIGFKNWLTLMRSGAN